MLGQPVSMLIPWVVGFKLTGTLTEGVTATDLVLDRHADAARQGRRRLLRRVLRRRARRAVARRPRDDRQHGARIRRHLRLLPDRPGDDQLPAVYGPRGVADRARRGVCARAGLWRDVATPDPVFTDTLSLDLSGVRPSLAGPRRPQDRVSLDMADDAFETELAGSYKKSERDDVRVAVEGADYDLGHGDVVIAAITSLHQHLEPQRARRGGARRAEGARARPRSKPWVKTSLAPGARSSPTISPRRSSTRISTLSASTSSATAARRASGTRARSPIRSRRRSPTTTSSPCPCSRGTAISRAACQPGRARQLPRLAAARRRLCDRRDDPRRHGFRAASPRRARGSRFPEGPLADQPGGAGHGRIRASPPTCSASATRRCSTAMTSGVRSTSPAGAPTPSRRPRPMCRTRPISRA